MNDTNWCYIGEYALSDIIIADDGEAELVVGTLLQSLEVPGIPQEIRKKIAGTITKTCRETGRQSLVTGRTSR
jgi:hypothetical protein